MDRVFTKFTEADKDYNKYVIRSRSQSHVEITGEEVKKTYVGLMINDKKINAFESQPRGKMKIEVEKFIP